MSNPPRPAPDAIMSRRGLAYAVAGGGTPLPRADVERWLLVNRVAFKCLKVDLFEWEHDPWAIPDYLRFAREHDLRLSLASRCQESPPPELAAWRAEGLLDLLLLPEPGAAALDPWLRACDAARLSVRLSFQAGTENVPLGCGCVVSVTFSGQDAAFDSATLSLAELFRDAGVEVNLVGLDPERAETSWRDHVLPARSATNDHQFWSAEALELAALRRASAWRLRTSLHAYTALRTSRLSQLDNFVLRILLHKRPRALSVFEVLHRLTRLGPAPSSLPRERPRPERVQASGRKRYFDEVDTARIERLSALGGLAREALATVDSRACDLTVPLSAIEAENAHTIELPGARRWFSLARVEKISEELGQFECPFTLRMVIGGGAAEFGGFALGSRARIMAPLPGFDHTLILHASARGQYVLLRDGQLVEPVEFEAPYYVPSRVPTRCTPRAAFWNLDKEITLQTPQVWLGASNRETLPPPLFSVVVVSVRYARRLQAVLNALARQEGFDAARCEIIVAHVPGLDATEDVLASFEAAYPEHRLLRAPFSEQDAKSKGFMINQSARIAAGEWVVIMDSDIIVPADFLCRLEEATRDNPSLIAPDGRLMLDHALTSKVLLGMLDPARDWETLASQAGEYRQREASGVPIGFLQCVRREILAEIPYEEWGHFEGADWRFAEAVRRRHGREVWLEGVPVLHLDHGGSQWYGTRRHY